MSRNQSSAVPEIRVEKHPPERRRSKTVTTHCGCCCCCCCCLHTIGALLGAASGSSPVVGKREYFVRDETDPEVYHKVASEGGGGRRAIGVFWGVFLLLGLVATFWPWDGQSHEPAIGLLIFAAPHVVLAALVVSLPVLLVIGDRKDLVQLGRIALHSALGFAIGFVTMCFLCMGNAGWLVWPWK